jgi:hypothetical protein
MVFFHAVHNSDSPTTITLTFFFYLMTSLQFPTSIALSVVLYYPGNENNLVRNVSRCRDSIVGITTGYGLDDRRVGIRVPVGSRIFSSPRRPDWLWGFTQPPIQWVKRQGREADHSPPASAEVKEMWIYTSTAPYAFMA